MGLIRITAPEGLPVSLDELKLHCRIDTDDFDDDLTLKLEAAINHVEQISRRALITQEWKLTLPRFPTADHAIVLPKGSLQEVSEITYTNFDGDEQTVDADDYLVSANREPALLVPAYGGFWPTDARPFVDSVQVTFTCGFGDAASDVPADLRHAILLFAGWAFQGAESDLSLGGTDTARDRAFRALVAKWVLRSDEVADAIEA